MWFYLQHLDKQRSNMKIQLWLFGLNRVCHFFEDDFFDHWYFFSRFVELTCFVLHTSLHSRSGAAIIYCFLVIQNISFIYTAATSSMSLQTSWFWLGFQLCDIWVYCDPSSSSFLLCFLFFTFTQLWKSNVVTSYEAFKVIAVAWNLLTHLMSNNCKLFRCILYCLIISVVFYWLVTD